MKKVYQQVLKDLKPLKIIEKQLMAMEAQGNKDPEVLPMHYSFLSEIIQILENLKEEIASEMAS